MNGVRKSNVLVESLQSGKAREILTFSVLEVTRGISAGDEDSFNTFYDRYAYRIYGYLLSVSSGDEHLTREAMQEAMIRVVRYIKPYSDEEVFWRWLKRISRTALYDLVRKKSTYARHMALLRNATEAVTDKSPDVHESRWKGALASALTSIAEFDRQLVEAFYYDGFSQGELAERHSTTRQAIASRLGRAREKMRDHLVKALSHG